MGQISHGFDLAPAQAAGSGPEPHPSGTQEPADEELSGSGSGEGDTATREITPGSKLDQWLKWVTCPGKLYQP